MNSIQTEKSRWLAAAIAGLMGATAVSGVQAQAEISGQAAVAETVVPKAVSVSQKQLDAARAKLKADGYAFGSLVESIVTSPQFRTKRGKDDPRE